MIMKIGIDVGYGYTKIVYGEDYESHIFPSVAAKAQKLEGVEADFGDFLFEHNGQKLFIGQAAMNAKSKFIKSAFDGDRLNSETFQHLFLCGLASTLKEDSEVSVVTGLPVNAFKRYRQDIEQFKTRHFVKLNGKDILININNLQCIPQPLGTYLKVIKSHEELKEQMVLIVDIGFKTTDLLVVDNDRPLPISQSINFGMSDIARVVVEYVNSETDASYTINQIDEILNHGFSDMGVRRPVDEKLLNTAKGDLIEGIWNRIQEIYPDYRNFDRIIFTGGTAKLLEEQIDSINLPSFVLASDSQLSNAIGYRDILG